MPQDVKQQPPTEPTSAACGQGSAISAADPEALRRALDEAVDYRGDVTLVLRDGRLVEGYLFDRRRGHSPAESSVRIMPSAGPAQSQIPATDPAARIDVRDDEIAELRFTGRDTAAGKTWENWVRRYAEKKLKGERAEIASESLE